MVAHLCMSYQPVVQATTYTTHNKQTRQISMPSGGFTPTIPVIRQFQTCALYHMANGNGNSNSCYYILWSQVKVKQSRYRPGVAQRFPDFVTTAQNGGKVVSLTHRLPLHPGNMPGTHFC